MPSFSSEQMELLAEKKLSGLPLTQEEQALLEAWLKQQPEEQVVWVSGDPDEEFLKRRLFARIRKDAGMNNKLPKKVHFIHRRWTVAAIFIVVCSAVWLLFFHQRRQKTIPTNVVYGDVEPGRTGAILTLANEQKIMLDSSANGTVSKQGNTTIINTNGLLAYKALQEKSTAIVYNTLTTGRGNQYQLILPDGSRVWLNAASSITYPTAFTGNNRRVTITGEVYFEVKHNSKSPFIVKTGMQEIEDIGTAFNVNAYPDESADITTLVEGKIKVVGYKMQGAGKNEIMLKPGEQARFTSSGIGNVVKDANIEAATAWKNGRFYFNGMELPVIMRQIARWYNVAIAYEGPVPAGHYMGSPSRNLSAAQMLQLLEYGGVKFRIEGRKIIVKQ